MATSPTTYTGSITQLVNTTGTLLTDALLGGSKWGTGPAGTAAALTFSFPLALDAFDTRPGVVGNYSPEDPQGFGFSGKLAAFSAFSPAQQGAARQVLQAFANVAQLSFSEVAADGPDAGVLRFANSAPPGMAATGWGVSWFPQDIAGAGDTWMNSAFLFPEGWAPGTQNFLTLLHEVGHALGLKHPHDGGLSGVLPGWPEGGVKLPFTGTDTLADESTQTMVMAYNDIPGRATIGDLALQSDFAPTTPMRHDITALQYLYGANMAYNAGNTVYTFDGNARYNQTIWDGGGIDTIVATGTRAVEIDLRPAQWSKLGQPMSFSTRNADNSVAAAQPQLDDPYTVFIYDTVTIENAVGGDGADGLIGNGVANVLSGGLGNDTVLALAGNDVVRGGAGSDSLDGGDGFDILDYRDGLAVSVDLLAGTATEGSDSDRLSGFEAVFGSGAADVLRGAGGAGSARGETLRGGGGSDSIDGGAGVDTAEFTGAFAGYGVVRNGSTITVTDTDAGNGDDGVDVLLNVERLVFGDRMLAFGERAEDIARVAFVLWSPAIIGSPALFSRGYSFYDNGYDFNFMCSVALQFHGEQGTAFAQKLVANTPGTTRTVDDVMALMTAGGGGDAGRAAAVAAMATDPATTAQIELSGIRVNGVVASLFVPDFGNLFGLLTGG